MRGGAGRGPRRSGQPGRRPRSTDSGCWHAPLARRQWCSLPCCGVCARSSCCLAACLHTARWAGLVFWEAARAWRLACLLRAVWQGRKGGLKVEGRSTALLLTNDNHQTFGPSRLHHRQRAGAPMVQCGVVSPNRCWPPLCCCWGRGGGGPPTSHSTLLRPHSQSKKPQGAAVHKHHPPLHSTSATCTGSAKPRAQPLLYALALRCAALAHNCIHPSNQTPAAARSFPRSCLASCSAAARSASLARPPFASSCVHSRAEGGGHRSRASQREMSAPAPAPTTTGGAAGGGGGPPASTGVLLAIVGRLKEYSANMFKQASQGVSWARPRSGGAGEGRLRGPGATQSTGGVHRHASRRFGALGAPLQLPASSVCNCCRAHAAETLVRGGGQEHLLQARHRRRGGPGSIERQRPAALLPCELGCCAASGRWLGGACCRLAARTSRLARLATDA